MSSKTPCFFCGVEQSRIRLNKTSYPMVRGGEEVLTCDSCMEVPGLVDRFIHGPSGQFMLMLNTKMDLILQRLSR